jgi:hypothetical protein
MFNIIYAPGETELASRLQTDLEIALDGETIRNTTIVLLSPGANQDKTVQNALMATLDSGQHIVPVMAKAAVVPELIDHLEAIDFTQRYDLNSLIERIRQLSGPDGGLPIRVRTPAIKAANRRFGYVMAALALAMFVAGLYLVGVMGVQAPAEEYQALYLTETVTIQAQVDRFLPRSTADALHFDSTLEAVPTALQPLLSDAATALVPEGE